MRNPLVLFYLVMTALSGAGLAAVLYSGAALQPAALAVAAAGQPVGVTESAARHPLPLLLIQIIVVVAAAKLLGAVFRRYGQPGVIGEMLAGILLGPSLLGAVSPAFSAWLFPPVSLGTLQLLSQIGVILFMFFVGIELDLGALRKRARTALMVSHASIVVPFLLGSALALVLYTGLAPHDVAFAPFALFLGTAMSITAFPVLARILKDRGLTATPLGITAIACAAVDDATAWCVLAVVVAFAKATGFGAAALTVALSVAFVAVMLLVLRPLIATLAERPLDTESQRGAALVISLLFVFIAALCTETIGIHALFGAFLAGAIMPSEARLSRLLRERVEVFAGVFLLPLFFAFTGLRTEIGLLDDVHDWLLCAGIVAVAIAGKFGGSMLAARLAGQGWRDAAAIGTLMNTRGLMELIVLNIGYDLGILSPRIFAMMVVMALVTTLMTGPLLSLLERRHDRARVATSLP